jgi:hypothetical protein
MMDKHTDKTAMPCGNKIEEMNALREASSQSCWTFPRHCTATNLLKKRAQTARPFLAQKTIAPRPNGSVMNRKKTSQASVQPRGCASRPEYARGKQHNFVICSDTDHLETFATLKATRGLMRVASYGTTKSPATFWKIFTTAGSPEAWPVANWLFASTPLET